MALPPSEKRLKTMFFATILLLALCLKVNASGLRGSAPELYELPLKIDEKTFIDCEEQANAGAEISNDCDQLLQAYQVRKLRRRRDRRANIFHRERTAKEGGSSSNAGSSQGNTKGATGTNFVTTSNKGKGLVIDGMLRSKKKGATLSPTSSGTAFPSGFGGTSPPTATASATMAPTVSPTLSMSPTTAQNEAANFQTAAPTRDIVQTVQAPASDDVQTSTPTTSALTPWSLAPQSPSYHNIFSRTHAPSRSPVFPPSGTLPSFSQVTFAPTSQTASPAPTLSIPITTAPTPTSTTPAPTQSGSTPEPTQSSSTEAPSLSSPKTTGPTLTSPKTTAPTLLSPKTTAPTQTSPKTTSPTLSNPKTTVPSKGPSNPVQTTTAAPSSPTGTAPSPPPQEAPTSAPQKICQLKNGGFGSLTGVSKNVTYQYQVQPFTNLTATEVTAKILPATKSNLDNRLLPRLFPATCKDPYANSTNRLRRRTQEGFTGLSSPEPDKIAGTVPCGNSTCFIVNGTITLYARGNITNDMLSTAHGKIQEIISSGALNGANDRVTLPSSSDSHGTKSPAPVASDSSNSVAATPLYGWIIIGVGGFVSVLAFFAVRWRLVKDQEITSSDEEKFDYDDDDHEVDADDNVVRPTQPKKASSVVDTDDDDYEDESPVSPKQSHREFALGPSLVSPSAANATGTIVSEKTSKSTGQHSNILHADDEVGAAAMAAGAAMAADAAGSVIHAGDDLSWGLHDDDELTEEHSEEEEESWEEEEDREEEGEEEEEEEEEVLEDEEDDDIEEEEESWERGFVQNPQTRGRFDRNDAEDDEEEEDEDDYDEEDDEDEEEEEEEEAQTLGKLQTNHRASDLDDEVSYDDEDDSYDDDDEFAEGTHYGQESRDVSGSLSDSQDDESLSEEEDEEEEEEEEEVDEDEDDYDDYDDDDIEESPSRLHASLDNLAVFAAAGIAVSSNASANRTESTQSRSIGRTESTQSRSNSSANKTESTQSRKEESKASRAGDNAVNARENSWQDSGEWGNQPFPSSDGPAFFAFGGSHHKQAPADKTQESEREDSHGEEYWKEEKFWDDGGDDERRSPRKRKGGGVANIVDKEENFQLNDGNNLSDDEKNLWELTTPAPDELKSFGSYGRKKGDDDSRRHSTGAFSAGSLQKLNKLPAGAVTEDGNIVSTQMRMIDARSAPERLDGWVPSDDFSEKPKQGVQGKGQGPSNVSISDGWMKKDGHKMPVSPSVDADLDWVEDPFKASRTAPHPKQPFKMDQLLRNNSAEPTFVGFMQPQSGWPAEIHNAPGKPNPKTSLFPESPHASASRGNSSRGSRSHSSKGFSGLPDGVFPFGMGEAVDRLLQELSDSDSYSEYDSKDSQFYDDERSVEEENLQSPARDDRGSKDVPDYENSVSTGRDGKPEDSESHTEPQGEDFDENEDSEDQSVDDVEPDVVKGNGVMQPYMFPGAGDMFGLTSKGSDYNKESGREQIPKGFVDEDESDEPSESMREQEDYESQAESQGDDIDESEATEDRSVDEAQQRLVAKRNGNPRGYALPGADASSRQGSEASRSRRSDAQSGHLESNKSGKPLEADFDDDEFEEPFKEDESNGDQEDGESQDDHDSINSEERSIDDAKQRLEAKRNGNWNAYNAVGANDFPRQVSQSVSEAHRGDGTQRVMEQFTKGGSGFGANFGDDKFDEPSESESEQEDIHSQAESQGDEVDESEVSEDERLGDAARHFDVSRTGTVQGYVPTADDLSGHDGEGSESQGSDVELDRQQREKGGIDHDDDFDEDDFEEPFHNEAQHTQPDDDDESEASEDDTVEDEEQNVFAKRNFNDQAFGFPGVDDLSGQGSNGYESQGSDDQSDREQSANRGMALDAFAEDEEIDAPFEAEESGGEQEDYESHAEDANESEPEEDANESEPEEDANESEPEEDDDGYADHWPDERQDDDREAFAVPGADDLSGQDSQVSESELSDDNMLKESESNARGDFDEDEFEEPFEAQKPGSEHDDEASEADSEDDDAVQNRSFERGHKREVSGIPGADELSEQGSEGSEREESENESQRDTDDDESERGHEQQLDDDQSEVEENQMKEPSEDNESEPEDDPEENDRYGAFAAQKAATPSWQKALHYDRSEEESDADPSDSSAMSDDEHDEQLVNDVNNETHDDRDSENDDDAEEESAHVVTDNEKEEDSEDQDETEGSKDESEIYAGSKKLNASEEMEFNQGFESSERSFADEDLFSQDKGDGFSSFTSFGNGKGKSFAEEEKVDDFANPFDGFGSKDGLKFSEIDTKEAGVKDEHETGDRAKWISSVWGIVDSEEDADDAQMSFPPTAESFNSAKPEAKASSPVSAQATEDKQGAVPTKWFSAAVGVDDETDEEAEENEFAFKSEPSTASPTLQGRQDQSSWFSDDMGHQAHDFTSKSVSESKGFESSNPTASQEIDEDDEEDDTNASFGNRHAGIQVPTKQPIDDDDDSDDDNEEIEPTADKPRYDTDEDGLSPKSSPPVRHSQLNRIESNPSLEGDESFYDEDQEEDEEDEGDDEREEEGAEEDEESEEEEDDDDDDEASFEESSYDSPGFHVMETVPEGTEEDATTFYESGDNMSMSASERTRSEHVTSFMIMDGRDESEKDPEIVSASENTNEEDESEESEQENEEVSVEQSDDEEQEESGEEFEEKSYQSQEEEAEEEEEEEEDESEEFEEGSDQEEDDDGYCGSFNGSHEYLEPVLEESDEDEDDSEESGSRGTMQGSSSDIDEVSEDERSGEQMSERESEQGSVDDRSEEEGTASEEESEEEAQEEEDEEYEEEYEEEDEEDEEYEEREVMDGDEEEEEEEEDEEEDDEEDDDTVAMEEAMAAMTDPDVMAEMAKIMMDDPEFQAQLAALDPSYVNALAEMMKDA